MHYSDAKLVKILAKNGFSPDGYTLARRGSPRGGGRSVRGRGGLRTAGWGAAANKYSMRCAKDKCEHEGEGWVDWITA